MTVKVLIFSAPWCKSCEVIKPTISDLVNMYSDVQFKEIDIDEEEEMTDEYNIKKIPTVVITKDNNELSRIQGTDTHLIRNMIIEHCDEEGDAEF